MVSTVSRQREARPLDRAFFRERSRPLRLKCGKAIGHANHVSHGRESSPCCGYMLHIQRGEMQTAQTKCIMIDRGEATEKFLRVAWFEPLVPHCFSRGANDEERALAVSLPDGDAMSEISLLPKDDKVRYLILST
jgi:hypothetical protein